MSNKKTEYRKAYKVATLLLVLCSIFCVGSTKVHAYSSEGMRCYTISSGTTPVYNENLTKIGSVYGEDELTIITPCLVNGQKMYKVRYKITGSSRTKDGLIYTSAVVLQTNGENVYAKKKLTTYKRPGGAEWGYINENEKLIKMGKKDGWIQVRYWSSNNGGYYKFAWVKSTSSQNPVQTRLDQIANGSLRYNSSTVMSVGSRFTGTRSDEQCKGYAKNCFDMCFGVTPGKTQDKPNNYLLNSTSGMTKVGSVTSMTTSNISNLFGKAKIGDFVQMRRTHGGSHSAIVYSVTSSSVTFLEANLDGNNTVYKKTYSWGDLCNKNAAMSVYTASSYTLK